MTDTIIDRLTSHLDLSATPDNFDVLLNDVKDAKDALAVNILMISNLQDEKVSLQKVIDAKPSNGWNIPAPPVTQSAPLSLEIKVLLEDALAQLAANSLSNVGYRISAALKLLED